ncbi:hypothetical protein BH23ACT9_BH23ACT9_15600 [soil metagenome]
MSTESLALAWARQEDAPEGALVTAAQELAARGRRTAVWHSVPGASLAASVVLRPALPVQAEGLLWLLAGVAAVDGLVEAADVEVGIEWPNELVVDGKVLGIVKAVVQLGPGGVELAVLTLRVNTAMRPVPPEIASHATSLALLGADVADDVVLRAFLGNLARHYDAGVAPLLAAFTQRCDTIGHQLQVDLVRRGRVHGTAAGVDPEGRLLVRSASGVGAVGLDLLERLSRAPDQP